MAAAPPLKKKLKQSLLDSFLPRKSTGHDGAVASADPPTPASPGVIHPSPSITSISTTDADAAEYERARQENIRRNRDFLQKLGIQAVPFGPKTATPPQPSRGPKRRQPGHSLQETRPLSAFPVRRSTRKSSLPVPSPETAQEGAGGESPEPLAPTYVDSSVFQYACEDAPEDVSSLASSSSSSPISGFKVTGRSLRDPSLAKIYAADVCRARDEKVLVAAGGHGGFISIFGVDLVEGDEEGGCDGTLERGVEEPLLSWKGSKSWVSGVLFAEDNPMLLISSSNDGAVVVWDVSKQSSPASSSVSPPVVAESRGMHSGGIFSMHRKGCSIATASKDSSVGLHMLQMDGQLVAERAISGHHRGVIRGICFGGTKHILADCGADRSICVLDARLPEPCTLTIESSHLSPINTVEWCPSNSSLLLSASKDPILRLYDIRNPRESVHELQGHVQTNARICSQIYRPTFVDDGAKVVTPGPASRRISVFSVEQQKLMSQGSIGYDANLVFFTGERTAQPRLWTAGKQMNQLRPLRLEASL